MEHGSCKVVVNHEEQYALWPADRANAIGWRDAGFSGPKEECLEYIRAVWTDMRPLSLRQAMAARRQDIHVIADDADSGFGDTVALGAASYAESRASMAGA
jgi:MbtH protein